ncbi:MAG TPA: nucleoside 2-deoxyribosyltransferase domain-containing protein [Fibrobacteria bacterium]|nr:nucleoside 2-deoxyribosyltransferase domain-containing protein [Fibrobacteria bacterium]
MKHIICPERHEGSESTLFLAGGISGCPNWHDRLVELLSSTDLTLLNPRRKNFPIDDPSASRFQIQWEHEHLHRAQAISFWFPRETLCPITLYELGVWTTSEKPLFIGMHPDYSRRIDVEIQTSLVRPNLVPAYSLEDLAGQILAWARTGKV